MGDGPLIRYLTTRCSIGGHTSGRYWNAYVKERMIMARRTMREHDVVIVDYSDLNAIAIVTDRSEDPPSGSNMLLG